MIALDFIDAGVRFVVTGSRIEVRGPVGRGDLLEQLRAEVDRRIPIVRGRAVTAATFDGWCDCGDEHDGGGLCALCALALQKIAETTPAHAAPEPPAKRKAKEPPAPPPDRWLAVESECPAGLGRQAHAGRLHVLEVRVDLAAREVGRAVRCVTWRPLTPGERASDAWAWASAGHAALEVPGARAAQYPPPIVVPLKSDEARLFDRLWNQNAITSAQHSAELRRRGLLGAASPSVVAHYEELRRRGLIDFYPEAMPRAEAAPTRRRRAMVEAI